VDVRYGSGPGIQDEIELDLANAAAQSLGPISVESLPPTDPQNPGTSAAGEARLAMDLGAGFFSMATGSEGEVLGFGVTRFGVGSTRASYGEDVLLESASLPDGTPVTIRLRYRIAFARDCLHGLEAEILAEEYPGHSCLTDLEVRATLNDLLGEVASATQNHYVQVGFPPTVTGLFADPSQDDELVVGAEVGDAIRIELFADAAGIHRLAGPYQAVSPAIYPDAATGTSLVLVFGIESEPPGVQVVSPLLGGPLPDFAGVTPEAAYGRALAVSIGAPVTVPEPSACLAALAALIALRRLRA